MWTYGGTYPGTTIRRPTGETTNVTFTNNLATSIGGVTVHNHGNHSTHESDGQPTDEYQIQPGQSRTYTYGHLEDGGNERGTMQFYHDHRGPDGSKRSWVSLAWHHR
jgi:FtsP/CotA-like multicopper oxidase with cupredoxin domain